MIGKALTGEQGRREMRSLWERTAGAREALARHTRDAVDDIRIKLVEEGWAGRSQTDPVRRWREPEHSDNAAIEAPRTSLDEERAAIFGDDGRKPEPSAARSEKPAPERDGPER